MNAGATASAARVEAQAKLNLFLRVFGRAPDGYHQLQTLFQRIALADVVTLRTGGTGRSLDCRGASLGPVEENLAWRAALAFADAAGWPTGFAIEIEKRIPVGGGLGGGSADAAAVLRALNALAPNALAPASLAAVAGGLGADVPYLATTSPLAVGTRRGERLVAVEPLAARSVLLLVPPFGVSTADAFGWHAAAWAFRGEDRGAPLTIPAGLSWSRVASLAANDLERAVFTRHPDLQFLRASLQNQGASIARMTGSGSTIFGVFDSRAAATRAYEAIGTVATGTVRIATTTVQHVAAVELL